MTVIQLLSFSVAILSVLAILVARRSLYNGLAHSAIMAMILGIGIYRARSDMEFD